MPKLKRYSDYREMLDKQKDIDARHRRDARSHARGHRVGGDGRRQARLRAEAALLVGAGSAAPGAEGEGQPKVVTQMGNQGHSTDGARTRPGIHHRRRDRRRSRSPRLDEPSARLLAAGHSAPGAAAAGESGRPLRWNGRGVEARLAAAMAGNYPVPDRLSWDLFLGVAPAGRVPPDLSPVQLARLGGLGPGRARRHGRAPDRSSRSGRSSSACRPAIETISTPFNGVTLSERDDDVLRVRRRAATCRR